MNNNETSFCSKILETSPTVIYIYDLIINENIYVNTYTKKYLGYSQEELREMGNSLYKLTIHPEDIPIIKQYNQQLLTLNDTERIEVKFRVKNKQGDYRWFTGYESIFKRGDNSVPIQKIGNIIDITEQENSAAELAAIIETSPFAYFILDNRGTYLKAYPDAAWYYSNLKPSEYTGKSIREVWSDICPSLVEDFYQKLPEILKSDFKKNFSITYSLNIPVVQQEHLFEIILTRIDDLRLLATVRDITDIKKLLDVKLGINSLKAELQNLEKSKIR